MLSAKNNRSVHNIDQLVPISLPLHPIEVGYDQQLLEDLSDQNSWGIRKQAAHNLGNLGSRSALPALLKVLPSDPFWMVRCEIIQALEKIGDPVAIPILQEVANGDRFQIVRTYAVKAIERLSHQ